MLDPVGRRRIMLCRPDPILHRDRLLKVLAQVVGDDEGAFLWDGQPECLREAEFPLDNRCVCVLCEAHVVVLRVRHVGVVSGGDVMANCIQVQNKADDEFGTDR